MKPSKCERCGSMMEEIIFYGKGESFRGSRCYACGEIVDQVILQNRAFSPQPRPTGGNPKGVTCKAWAREREIERI